MGKQPGEGKIQGALALANKLPFHNWYLCVVEKHAYFFNNILA